MPIYVVPVDSACGNENEDVGAEDSLLSVIRAGISAKDNCPILTRLKAFIVDRGVLATLEHIFHDRQGRPVDLTKFVQQSSESASESASESQSASFNPDPATSTVVLRVKEWLGSGAINSCGGPIYEIAGDVVDATGGVIRATLTTAVVDMCGIYQLSWGVRDNLGVLVAHNDGIMSVEQTLFAFDNANLRQSTPPTLTELRMWMMDSAPAENLLLQDVEFGDEQLMLAMSSPVRKWNETPPFMSGLSHTTRSFPYRDAWATGTLGELYVMAAAHYRRNTLASASAGLSVDDKNKEREYMAEGLRLRKEYFDWVRNTKVAINMNRFSANIGSPLSRRR